MDTLDIAFVGTGADPETQNNEGFSMAYRHGSAYARLEECSLEGAADVVPENATAFAEYFDIPSAGVHEDHREMLEAVRPDVVSVCTPPHTHADIVVDCTAVDSVQAIHCEKPMARGWADCERMLAAAADASVKLTFNHQRRFGAPYREAKALLSAGEIGELERVEMAAPNIYDYGSHSIDLCNYFNDEGSAAWVIGQLDYSIEDKWFGVHNENQTLASWEYENGVEALASTGELGGNLVNCHNRLIGTDGVIEIGHGFPNGSVDDEVLRIRRDTDDRWESVDTDGEGLHGFDSAEYGRAYIDRAIEDVVTAVLEDDTSELDADNALDATEIIFAVWESSRDHGRVSLPLEIEDNPLDAMIESGELTPEPADE